MTNIPAPAPAADIHLTPQGAIFGVNVSTTSRTLYDWNNGTFDSLGYYTEVGTAGNYCLYYCPYSPIAQPPLILRNLATQTSQVLSTMAMDASNDVTSGGVAVFSKVYYGTNIDTVVRWANGSSANIGDNLGGQANFMPLTDGKNIVYQEHVPGAIQGATLYLYNGTTSSILSDFSSQAGMISLPLSYYQVKNGYVAYEKLDNNAKLQSWIWDSTGNNTQISFFSTSSKLDRLGSNGDLLFFPPPVVDANFVSHSYRNLYRKGAGILQVCSNLGTSYYQDSTWYIAIGKTLFRLNPTLTPNRSDDFSVNLQRDSTYMFSTSSFSSHFEGSGTLMSVVFTRVPAHGTLKTNGAQVFVNRSVARTALTNLVYTPMAGYTGTDTAYWVGSNGYTNPVDTGMLLLQVSAPAPPVQPVIAGLNAAYCSNGGTAAFAMSNFPDTSKGTVVSDSLDNRPLTLGASASCSIALSGLAAGMHTVKVTYTNTAGSSSYSQSFSVVSAVTPVVGVNATYTTIPGTVASVMVTATNVSGGGSTPSYSFALNRGFLPLLRGPGPADSVVIDTAALGIGANTVYVRMRTSDTCYTVQSVTDSLVITRSAPAGGGGGSGLFIVGPNPFRDELEVSGLVAGDAYTISLLNSNGMEVVRTYVAGVNRKMLDTGPVTTGIYVLRVYDSTLQKVVGMVRLLAMGNN